MCEHKTVLAIYQDKPHTKYNISHFRCPRCGKKETYSFGVNIIYDHNEVKEERMKHKHKLEHIIIERETLLEEKWTCLVHKCKTCGLVTKPNGMIQPVLKEVKDE